MAKKIAVLVILDGWGIGKNNESNPIYVAKPQVFERLKAEYPMTSIQASGISVGLPWGEVGNSEVGHLTLGAGKVLYQYYPKITMAIRDGSFFENKVLKDVCAHARTTGGAVNLAGLLTKGNVHASLEQVEALIKMAQTEGVTKINLHLFADGKDVQPHTLQGYLAQLPEELLATLVGRYYAMDRNGNWTLTETAYQLMTGMGNTGQPVTPAEAAGVIEATYKQGQTEEYLSPLRFSPKEDTGKTIKDGDSLFFFNYREDSIQQLASAFILPDFDKFAVTHYKDLFVATMTHYNDAYDVPVAFPADTVKTPLGKVISDAGLTQLRLAETYKYAHVTYFFNGYKEQPFPGEFRTLIPSNSGLHPETHPEMMATAITDRLIEAIRGRAFDFILVNYANGDTIAHTADYNAGIEAVKVIDRELTRVLAAVEEDPDALLAITSDHGNIEKMIDEATGLSESQHDASPVPFYLVEAGLKGRKFVNANNLTLETLGSLADVAPTMLALMGLPKPEDMTGRSLLDGLI
ncbi:MAG: 2,3-bisphosphoglycerate-independent phosphoglycerate mutase [Candidatus Pacebacteria bacterium]|nr:2,3-bisphosphoglycerate-independent phosphoglycerate mutase [Candidatus Paceibacterota bacterium]